MSNSVGLEGVQISLVWSLWYISAIGIVILDLQYLRTRYRLFSINKVFVTRFYSNIKLLMFKNGKVAGPNNLFKEPENYCLVK